MWSLKIAQRLSYPLKSLPDIRHSWGSYRSSRRPSRPSPPAETSVWGFEPAHPCVVRAFHYISGSKYLQKQPLYTAIKCQDTFYSIHTHFFAATSQMIELLVFSSKILFEWVVAICEMFTEWPGSPRRHHFAALASSHSLSPESCHLVGGFEWGGFTLRDLETCHYASCLPLMLFAWLLFPEVETWRISKKLVGVSS